MHQASGVLQHLSVKVIPIAIDAPQKIGTNCYYYSLLYGRDLKVRIEFIARNNAHAVLTLQ